MVKLHMNYIYIATVSLRVIATVVMSVVSYFVIEIVLRNEAIRKSIKTIGQESIIRACQCLLVASMLIPRLIQ